MKRILFPSILCCFFITFAHAAETPALILAENLEQAVTSSTLQWVPFHILNDTMLEFGVIASYEVIEDQESDNMPTKGQKPVYVCRAKINSIWVSGQLRPKKRICVVSLYKTVYDYDKFDVLINIENSARLSWVFKDKYNLNSQGAVTNGEETLRTFVARRPAKSHNKLGSLSHYVGKYDPSENLGVFDLIDQNNQEVRFEDGEILVETEPMSYEFKGVKFDNIRSRPQKNRRFLGHAVLKNTESGSQRVDTVITYTYVHTLFWGKGHGILTGLNFTVHLPKGMNLEGTWGVPSSKNVTATKTIESYLAEGTAVNVTLYGNYTDSETPYMAIVSALYSDNERRNRTIADVKREQLVTDVLVEFGPVYFLHNNSYVPTTTSSTTTTTTTTTTSKTTSTTHEATPIVPPPHVVIVENSEEKQKTTDKSEISNTHENNSMQSDASGTNQNPLTMKKKDVSTPSSAAYSNVNLILLGVIFTVVRRVT